MAVMKSAMTKTVIVVTVAIASATAQTRDISPWTFQHYPVVEDFKGSPAKPLLVTPHERSLRTQILDQAGEGPNFAGHFTIAHWGCGSPCVGFFIINERTGTIYDPHFAVACADNNQMDSSLDFNLNSRLIVATRFSDKFGCGTDFLEWDGKRLKSVYFEPWSSTSE